MKKTTILSWDVGIKHLAYNLSEYDEDIEFEIKQLEKLTRDECEKHLSKKLIGIDPGKHSIVTMTDEEGNYYSYSNCRRRNDTYSKRSNQIVLAEKAKNSSINETGFASYKLFNGSVAYEKSMFSAT